MTPRPSRTAPPLDAAALDRLALRYVERFQTTRAKLARYLDGKIRQRGWDGPAADPQAVADRMAALGYIDDRAFGEARAAGLTRRGYGARRVAGALHQAGLEGEAVSAIVAELEPGGAAAALALARKRRIGPFADRPADRPLLEKHIATLVRGGHDFALSRRIAAMAPGEDFAALLDG